MSGNVRTCLPERTENGSPTIHFGFANLVPPGGAISTRIRPLQNRPRDSAGAGRVKPAPSYHFDSKYKRSMRKIINKNFDMELRPRGTATYNKTQNPGGCLKLKRGTKLLKKTEEKTISRRSCNRVKVKRTSPNEFEAYSIINRIIVSSAKIKSKD